MNILASFALALLAPGAAQAFNGRRWKAWMIGGFYIAGRNVLAPLFLRFLYRSPAGIPWMVGWMLAFEILMIAAFVDALADPVRDRLAGRVPPAGRWRPALIAAAAILLGDWALRAAGLPRFLRGF